MMKHQPENWFGKYLSGFPELIILEECNNGVDAIQAIHKFQPDLVFLDIQMPGLTGLELLSHLTMLPQIIFTTAYDQYALKAFEINAVDYLLKPYTRERFQEAVQRSLKADNSYLISTPKPDRKLKQTGNLSQQNFGSSSK